jgi:hypothetical protein
MSSTSRAIGWCWGAFVLAGLALGCASGGAGPAKHVARTGLTAADYYPLTVGWKWAYDLEKDGEKILAIYSVLERTPGEALVLAGGGGEHLSYAITPEGIAQLDSGARGDFVLKNPLVAGATWPVADGTAKVISTSEEVTVDAGHFYDCAVVEVTRTEPMRIARTTFAPDIGPVSIEYQVQEGGKFTVTTRARLRSVTKPGDDLFGAPRSP